MNPSAYLQFNGQCAEAFAFYAQLLGAQLGEHHPASQSPMADQLQPHQKDWTMHAQLHWPNGQVLMGCDALMGPYEAPRGFHLTLNRTSVDEARALFDALAAGGQVQMPFEPTFWAAGFGMLVDRFGVPWMVNVDAPTAA
ncbi:PhnB protein [Inhella inkyongensis]|uniref:PhnB protein n=1 Tax=Inhella inkyongensis TaxID=392593 RepID=A0A840S0W4_9BURK|nr:VOC family protein [Inhella inkyongensis]MBB5202716.1 PhnB protein [Inhella inkyongensis]